MDIASLVFFRIAFGLLMLFEVIRYFAYGWIGEYWIEPRFLFGYYGFSWMHPWPGIGIYLHMALLGLFAIFIAFGFAYRVSAILLFLGFTFCFLLEQAIYLNHFYLVCLLSFLLIFAPANRALAIDSWLHPQLRSNWVPAWTVWIFPRADGDCLFLQRPCENLIRLASRRTDADVVSRARRFAHRWSICSRSMAGLSDQLRRHVARFINRAVASLAPDPGRRILPRARFSFDERVAFFHRHLSVGCNRGHRSLPFAGLATPLTRKCYPKSDLPRENTKVASVPQNKPFIVVLIATYFTIQILIPLRPLVHSRKCRVDLRRTSF